MLNNDWKYYGNLYRGQYCKLTLTVLATIGQSLFILPTVYVVKYVFDVLIPTNDFSSILLMGLVLMVIIALGYAINLWSVSLTLKITKDAVSGVRKNVIDKCFRLSRKYFTQVDIDKLHASIVQDTHRLDVMSNALVSQFIPQAVIVVTLTFVLLYLNWVLFVTLALVFPALYGLKLAMRDRQKKRIQEYHRSFEEYSKGVVHLLRRMDLIRVQSAEQMEQERQIDLVENVKTTSYSMALTNNAYKMLQSGLTAEVGVLMLVVGGLAVGKGAMTLGALLSFYVAAARMSSALNSVFASIPRIAEGNESLFALYQLVVNQNENINSGTKCLNVRGRFQFLSASFAYNERLILNRLDLTIQQSSITALLGENGIGKSTIVNLLLGFYHLSEGVIQVDDENYSELDLNHLRQQVGVVFQDQVFFSGSIRDNICYGMLEVDEQELLKVCELTMVSSFTNELPSGLDSKLGENGVLLSGGQKQKIALARAVIRKPKLLVLDEPTNHLDAESIHCLMLNLRNLDFSPAILLITQDRSVAQRADKIYSLSAEGVVEVIGTTVKAV